MPPLSRLARLSRQPKPSSPILFSVSFSSPSTSPLRRRCYSSTTEEPLIRVTNLPAPGSGHIRILELNRPGARNAISRALLHGLRTEVDGVHAQYDPETGDERPAPRRFGGAAGPDEKGPTRALVVASAVDSCFCAGADLKERRGFTPEEYVLSCSALLCSLLISPPWLP